MALLALLLAPAAQAQSLSAWDQQRAEAFTRVCLGSAPSFANAGRNAGALGFRNSPEGLLLEPEVVMSLQQNADTCSCFMTMGAPDQDALVAAIFREMLNRHGEDFRPDSRGMVNDTVFDREGTTLRVTLVPAEIDGQPWIAARATREGLCRQ